ncbi:MAG: amino acid adenylation domain-containing protein [Pirellulales bacterium]
MNTSVAIHYWLTQSAERYPAHVAVEEGDTVQRITYADLDALSDCLRDRLIHWGIQRGNRVGIDLTKSVDAVAAIYGILKAGAAYVPVDPNAPASRNAYILNDCHVSAVVVERKFVEELDKELRELGARMPQSVVLDRTGGGDALKQALQQLDASDRAPKSATVDSHKDDLAYILYTSGSTGRPKGVMLSHENGVSFVDWCSETFKPTHEDRFSSHAPFHFDLSILDLHLPIKHGATIVIISHERGREPVGLARLMHERGLTIWYSAPSILTLLAQQGKLDQYDWSRLRSILFAGEVFPIKHFRLLKSLIPHPSYFNLYGPTETNVCTFYRVPVELNAERTEPYPIGRTCSHLQSKIIMDGKEVAPGEEGELCISGAGVMKGYWNQPQQTDDAFFVDESGGRWYRTGDIVVADEQGEFIFRGRRDRMVKRRGYRVELGEIEACLYRHSDVKEAAVVALADVEGVTIHAFVALADGVKPSLIAMKRFCSGQIPLYMIPDRFKFLDRLPKTSTDKIDYQRLKQAAAER